MRIPNPIKIANGTRYDGPAITHTVTLIETKPFQAKSTLTDLHRELWTELHNKQDATPKWFADWVSRVPNTCGGCRDWLILYLETTPPRFDDFPRFTWELHNAVNLKLGRNEFSWADFVQKYDS